MTDNERSRSFAALAIVSFFWGTTYLASRIGAAHIPGFFLSGMRNFTAGAILVGVLYARGHRFPDKRTLLKIVVQGIFMLCLSNGLMTWAMQYISSSLGAIISALVPLLIAMFSVLMLKNAKFTLLMLLGLVIGFLGIAAIFYEYLADLLNPEFAFGIILALIATTSWSFGSVYTAKNNLKVDILFGAGLQMLSSGIIMLPICFATGKYINLLEMHISAWWALIYLVLIGSILSYAAYVYAISKLPPTIVSIYAYINPIVAVGLGWLILDEKLNASIGIGTAITLLGVYLVNNEFKKQTTPKYGKLENC